jgi:hypothetical protein
MPTPIFPVRTQWGWHLSLGKLRSFLYWLARLLGDVNAVRRGRIGRRIARRLAGRATGRLLGRIFK